MKTYSVLKRARKSKNTPVALKRHNNLRSPKNRTPKNRTPKNRSSFRPLTPRTLTKDYQTRGLMGQPVTITLDDDEPRRPITSYVDLDQPADDEEITIFPTVSKKKGNKRTSFKSSMNNLKNKILNKKRKRSSTPVKESNNPPRMNYFDPNVPPNYNFYTSEINTVPGGVFEFAANKPIYPQMGTKSRSAGSVYEPPQPKLKRHRSIGNIMMEDQIFNNRGGGGNGNHLRPIVIDGSNIAFAHGKAKYPLGKYGKNLVFSSRGIDICVEYFRRRGHTDITAFVPLFRLKNGQAEHREILEKLERNGNLSFTPSRTFQSGRSISSYDDRYIVQYAAAHQGIIVSNDNYRDLVNESRDMKEAIENRLLMFTFVKDTLMFPHDPLGKNGPKLDSFLSFN